MIVKRIWYPKVEMCVNGIFIPIHSHSRVPISIPLPVPVAVHIHSHFRQLFKSNSHSSVKISAYLCYILLDRNGCAYRIAAELRTVRS